MKDIAQGGAVELDYGVDYMLPREEQIHKYEGSEVGRLMHAVLKQFDPRVAAAFDRYMLSGRRYGCVSKAWDFAGLRVYL